MEYKFKIQNRSMLGRLISTIGAEKAFEIFHRSQAAYSQDWKLENLTTQDLVDLFAHHLFREGDQSETAQAIFQLDDNKGNAKNRDELWCHRISFQLFENETLNRIIPEEFNAVYFGVMKAMVSIIWRLMHDPGGVELLKNIDTVISFMDALIKYALKAAGTMEDVLNINKAIHDPTFLDAVKSYISKKDNRTEYLVALKYQIWEKMEALSKRAIRKGHTIKEFVFLFNRFSRENGGLESEFNWFSIFRSICKSDPIQWYELILALNSTNDDFLSRQEFSPAQFAFTQLVSRIFQEYTACEDSIERLGKLHCEIKNSEARKMIDRKILVLLDMPIPRQKKYKKPK